MKINKLFVLAAVCGSTILASCDYQAGLDRQRAYTKATLADNDAFNYIKLVGEEAVSLVALTQYADSVSSSAQVKALHAKVKDVYITLLPELDSVACFCCSVKSAYPALKPVLSPYLSIK